MIDYERNHSTTWKREKNMKKLNLPGPSKHNLPGRSKRWKPTETDQLCTVLLFQESLRTRQTLLQFERHWMPQFVFQTGYPAITRHQTHVVWCPITQATGSFGVVTQLLIQSPGLSSCTEARSARSNRFSSSRPDMFCTKIGSVRAFSWSGKKGWWFPNIFQHNTPCVFTVPKHGSASNQIFVRKAHPTSFSVICALAWQAPTSFRLFSVASKDCGKLRPRSRLLNSHASSWIILTSNWCLEVRHGRDKANNWCNALKKLASAMRCWQREGHKSLSCAHFRALKKL